MIGKVCTSAAFVFLATLGALQATPVVLLPVFGGVTVGETRRPSPLPPLLVRRPRPRALHTRFGPAVTGPCRLDAVKIENADELAFIYGEE
jgi:hypothetical protein